MSKPRAAKPAPPPPAPSVWKKAAGLGASPLAYPLISVPLLAPCFWQSRIQAGDLASHVYNAWLAQLVSRGQAPGLAVVPQATNILFDLMLSGFAALFGMGAAERIAVSLCVLVFAWGAFAFASAVAGRRPWSIFPAIAMLAYGWVFHIGFFNFYLSLGLCFWAMALLWEWNPRRAAAAVAILALAFAAHALPVGWAVALMAYRRALTLVAPRRRLLLAAAAVAALVAARVAIGRMVETHYTPPQIILITGASQFYVFDAKYQWISLAMLALWVSLVVNLFRGSRGQWMEAPFHFCLLSSAAVFVLPAWILIPGYQHALAFITERLALPLAVCICVLIAGPLGAPKPRPWQAVALAGMALVFFGMLYRDEAVLNGFEDRLQHLVAELPAGRRVINVVNDPALRSGPLTHMIDRVCTGRCYSYANYEPSTAQFRVRVKGPNPIVAASYPDSLGMQAGTYVVKPTDLPLYEVDLSPEGRLAIRSLSAGMKVGSTSIDLL